MPIEIITLLIALSFTVIGGVVIGAVMHRPLTLILQMLCHGEEAARFWVVFCKIVFVLLPMFAVSLFVPPEGQPIAASVPTMFSLAAGGLLLPVLVMGWAVWANRGLADQPVRAPTEVPTEPWSKVEP